MFSYYINTDEFSFEAWNRAGDFGIFSTCPDTGRNMVAVTSSDCRDDWIA